MHRPPHALNNPHRRKRQQGALVRRLSVAVARAPKLYLNGHRSSLSGSRTARYYLTRGEVSYMKHVLGVTALSLDNPLPSFAAAGHVAVQVAPDASASYSSLQHQQRQQQHRKQKRYPRQRSMQARKTWQRRQRRLQQCLRWGRWRLLSWWYRAALLVRWTVWTGS